MKKTNKTFKRFAAITSASLLAACAVMPAIISAAEVAQGETSCTITVNGWNTSTNNDKAAHTLEAYQVFKGKLDSTGKILTDVDFGDGITGATLSANLVTASGTENHALYGLFPQLKDDEGANRNYTAEEIVDILNSKKTVTETVPDTGTTTEVEKDIFAFDSDTTQAFAEIVAGCLTEETSGTYTAAAGEDKATISDLPVGYYLIQDEEISSEDDAENTGAKTRYILQLTETNASINIKASAPTVMKKVQEDSLTAANTGTVDFAGNDEYNPGTGYNDVADYDIGDDVPFKLYGTMPSTLEDYDHYYYKFTDTLGSQFDKPTNVIITIGETKLYYYPNVDNDTGEITYYQTTDKWGMMTEGLDNNCSVTFEDGEFVVSFKDIKNYADVDKDTVVTVEYNAVLNDTANIGYEGQLNKVDLTYSNNPNEEYKPWNEDGTSSDDEVEDTGTTKEDGVIVFTYGFDINKYKNGVETDKLAGAKFAVYYLDENDNKVYIKTDANNCYDGDLDTAPTDKTEVANGNGVWESDENGNIVINGLDVGTYYITEIEAPDGYNKLDGDIEVEVASSKSNADIYTQSWTYSDNANYVKDADGNITGKSAMDLITINYADEAVNIDDDSDDLGTVNIENKSGTSLPGTGGIGTTIFYLGGGAMAAIGGVYLISKRRMKKSEE